MSAQITTLGSYATAAALKINSSVAEGVKLSSKVVVESKRIFGLSLQVTELEFSHRTI